MKPSAKFLTFSLVFILLLMLALSACGGITPSDNENVATSIDIEDGDIPNDNSNETLDGNGSAVPLLDYSKFIGIWRGYAIAAFETLVITDVNENEMVFLFVWVMKADGSPNSVSSVYTMPIIDNQIHIIRDNSSVILTFHDDHISLLRIFDDGEFEFEWTLRRLCL